MELETNSKYLPLLTNEDSYSTIDSMSTLDKLKCVSYKDVYIKKRVFKKDIICSNEKVKILQEDEYVIPSQFVYTKNDRNYMSGNYISVLLLDSLKQLKEENKNLKDTVYSLQKRIFNLEKKIR